MTNCNEAHKGAIMRHHVLALPILLLTMLVGSPALSADFKRGLGAYKQGDYVTALKEWEPLAEQGDALAQFKLGRMYARGEGVPKNYTTAFKLFTLAAEQGNADAQNNLGVSYIQGEGVLKNPREALKWFLLAAEQGKSKAQNNLGKMYAKGDGVPKDRKVAVKWYRLAAEQGDVNAQEMLGLLIAVGGRTQKDFNLAKWDFIIANMWLIIAASHGDEKVKDSRDKAAILLSPTQLETAQKLAREWLEKHQK